METVRASTNRSARRTVAATFGILVGLAGIEHGFFEMLQGNVRPDSILFAAIGPEQRFWEYGTEHAFTLVPSLLVTGILAMLVGLLVTAWASRYVQSKYGPAVLLLLSVLLFLVGGGFAPIFLAVVATITATQINKPLTWWRKYTPAILQAFLAWLWPWSLTAFVLVFIISVELAIFGYPLVSFLGIETTQASLWNMANVMLGLMLLAPLTACAHDTSLQIDDTAS